MLLLSNKMLLVQNVSRKHLTMLQWADTVFSFICFPYLITVLLQASSLAKKPKIDAF